MLFYWMVVVVLFCYALAILMVAYVGVSLWYTRFTGFQVSVHTYIGAALMIASIVSAVELLSPLPPLSFIILLRCVGLLYLFWSGMRMAKIAA